MSDVIEPEVVNDIESLTWDMIDALKNAGAPIEFLGISTMENVTPMKVTIDTGMSVTVPNPQEEWLRMTEQTAPSEYAPEYPLKREAEDRMIEELQEALYENWPDQNKWDAIRLVLQKYNIIR